MATEKVSGGVVKNTVPIAAKVRNVNQAIIDIFNQALVDRMFEEGSIPNSKLSNIGVELPITVVTAANNTLDNTQYTILCDCSSNDINLDLPTVIGNVGLVYNIKKIDSTNNIVTVDGFGSQTIDDGETATILTQYESITIQATLTGWWII